MFPICLLCFGYPTQRQRERPLTSRFDKQFVVFENRYRRLSPGEFEEMLRPVQRQTAAGGGSQSVGQAVYTRKFNAGFTKETNRSVRAMLRGWAAPEAASAE